MRSQCQNPSNYRAFNLIQSSIITTTMRFSGPSWVLITSILLIIDYYIYYYTIILLYYGPPIQPTPLSSLVTITITYIYADNILDVLEVFAFQVTMKVELFCIYVPIRRDRTKNKKVSSPGTTTERYRAPGYLYYCTVYFTRYHSSIGHQDAYIIVLFFHAPGRSEAPTSLDISGMKTE